MFLPSSCCYAPYIYKIQRDGRRFQKFFAAGSSGNLSRVATLGHAIGR